MSLRVDKESSIATFYAGRNVFVTGATGFLGKVLLEKLLRSCPDIGEIFLLMRPKRGLSIDDRLRKMLQLPLFDKLRKENPSSFDKLIPVYGDMLIEGFGLPPVERQTVIQRVSVIFHVAANVRFNENLKKDILSNVRSTRDVCILAGSMKKLVALVHVSTAYCQTDKPVIDETLYPSPCDWKSAIKVVENLDENIIQIFASKYIGQMSNTYTFSKRLAEQVIRDYSKDLPCVVIRPSIVISSLDDPISGWLDNFNGPVGLMVGGGKGILRVVLLQPNMAGDYLPVDVAIKIMILAARKRGLQTVTKDPSVHVYNASSYQVHRITNQELVSKALVLNEKTPLEGAIWYPRTFLTPNVYLHYILTLILHVIPALIIDELLLMTGRKPMLLSIQKKIYSSIVALHYFLHNEWIFRNKNMLELLTTEVPPAEREIFGFDYTNFQVDPFLANCVLGAKRYLLNEDMSRLEQVKQHYNRMKTIDTIFNGCLVLLLILILWKSQVFSYIFSPIILALG